MEIEYTENLNDELYEMIGIEFNKFAEKNGLKCDYKSFNFIAKDNGNVIGLINGHSYYDEIYISDFIVKNVIFMRKKLKKSIKLLF